MTPLLAATTLTITATAIYALLCWVLPFGKCVRCSGNGVRETLTGRLKPCRPCKGAGLRLRHGRKIFNYFHHIHRDAERAANAKERIP